MSALLQAVRAAHAPSEAEERAAVVREALSWLGTPWHHRARVKGAGVDCGQFLAAVFIHVGLVAPFPIAEYPQDWNLHRDAERFLETVQTSARRVLPPARPGDLVLFQYGRCISHGGIVVKWPGIVHAWRDAGVVLDDVTINEELRIRYRGLWSVWGRR